MIDESELTQYDGMDYEELMVAAKFLHMENQRLRYKLHVYDTEHPILQMKAKAFEAENAKLREYVTAVANDVYGSELFDCSGCRFFDGCYNDAEKEHDGRECQWFLWARELGIEVE